MYKLLWLAPVLSLLPFSNVHAQSLQNVGAHYSFEFIALPNFSTASVYALGINDNSDVVGYYLTESNCWKPGDICDVGYLKDSQGYHDIYFDGAAYFLVWGINDYRTMVGTCCGTSSAHSPAFEYDIQTASFTRVWEPGEQATFFTSINNLGVIGGYGEAPGNLTTGFLLQNGIFTQIVYPGASGTSVYGVNSSGQAIGNATIALAPQGFLYQNGTFQAINYPGSAGTSANGINDNGDIVGAYTLPGSTVSYGFIYHNGSFLPFDRPGCKGTIPQGINNHGVIVGETCGGAFIATPMPRQAQK